MAPSGALRTSPQIPPIRKSRTEHNGTDKTSTAETGCGTYFVIRRRKVQHFGLAATTDEDAIFDDGSTVRTLQVLGHVASQ
jgi:hypothetical protein